MACGCKKTFGNTDGARLTAKYVQLQPQASADLQKMFEYALKDNRTTVSVKAYTREAEPKIGAIRAVLEAMSVPAAIYTADGSNSNSQYSAVLGDYVFVDGGFRFLNSQVLQALSTAPAMRIRVGGNVAAAKLVHRVSPIYPPITQTAHIKGTVRLHVIVGVDGAPKEITVVSGDQALAQSSLDAVRQWRYAVTTLNGAPVEVDTTVDVVFQ
jgi:TonB family protein